MALDYFKLEKGLRITGAGVDTGILMLTGSGAPTQDADVGSQYLDQADGRLYTKILSGAGAEKWSAHAFTSEVSALIGVWRKEKVVVATGDALSAGVIQPTVTPFSDQEDAILISEYAVGKLILSSVGSAVAAWEITDVSGDDVTIVAASVSEDDTFLVEHYLPDPTGQESISIVVVKAGVGQKVADIDWKDGKGILVGDPYIAGGFGGTNPDPAVSASMNLNEAIALLEQKTNYLLYQIGTSNFNRTDIDLDGTMFPSRNIQDVFWNLDVFLSSMKYVSIPNVSGLTVVDTISGNGLYDGARASCKWILQVIGGGTNASKTMLCEILALGSPSGSSNQVADFTVYGKVFVSSDGSPSEFPVDISVTNLNGVISLKVETEGTFSVFARRMRLDHPELGY